MAVFTDVVEAMVGLGGLSGGAAALIGTRNRKTLLDTKDLVQANKEQLAPRNGRTVAQTSEDTVDEVRQLRRELIAFARVFGRHMRQADIDRAQLNLPPAEGDDPA